MRILLADDHVLLTDMLALHLRKLGPDLSLETVQSVSALLEVSPEPKFDLIILDLHMPGMHGFAGMALTRRHFPNVPIAVMSGDITQNNMQSAMVAGATGFIPKTIGGKAIVDAVRLLASGGQFFPGYEPDSLINSQAPRPGSPSAVSDAIASLTRRERDVLRVLCTGASNIEIGKSLRVEPVTVGLYLRNVYRKLDVSSRGQAIKLCLESGVEV